MADCCLEVLRVLLLHNEITTSIRISAPWVWEKYCRQVRASQMMRLLSRSINLRECQLVRWCSNLFLPSTDRRKIGFQSRL